MVILGHEVFDMKNLKDIKTSELLDMAWEIGKNWFDENGKERREEFDAIRKELFTRPILRQIADLSKHKHFLSRPLMEENLEDIAQQKMTSLPFNMIQDQESYFKN